MELYFTQNGYQIHDYVRQQAQNTFSSIIHQIINGSESLDLKTEFFKILNNLLPRINMVSQQDKQIRSLVIGLFYFMKWQVRLNGENTSTINLKKYLLDGNQLYKSITGSKLYALKDCFKGYHEIIKRKNEQ